MPAIPPSARFRAQLRTTILERIAQLGLSQAEAAERMGFSKSQMSKLCGGEDVFTLDRLVDAATRFGLAVHLAATRPYRAR